MLDLLADIPVFVSEWPWEMFGRLVLAGVLGAVIGLEREHHGRSAGFRTQLLVGLGSALVAIVSLHYSDIFGKDYGNVAVRVDAARALGGVMGGIGFLGAGAILRHEGSVEGLTTAASLWCTAAVGLCCGVGLYGLAILTAGLTVFALLVLGRLDDFIRTRVGRTIVVTVQTDKDNLRDIRSALRDQDIRLQNVKYERDFSAETEKYTLSVLVPKRLDATQLLTAGLQIPRIRHISIG